tara:strand:+ start:198 stop:395 length:198 start_codon:yes stop_codon:yes gene_type:complete
MKDKFLVLWRDMMKDSDEPLPMRSFDSKEQAKAYVMGCADVICVTSKNELEPEKVMRDFIVTEAQ